MVDNLTPVKVHLFGVYRTSNGYSVILESEDRGDVLPVFVSEGQALSIEVGKSEKVLPRPLTHDLMLNIIEDLGLEIESVTIDDLMDGTFLAELRLVRGDRIFPYDVRPSDGIALAVRSGSEISVSEEVMDRAGRDKEEMLDRESGR